MPDVFISYGREDRVRAEQIARGLSMLGLEAFWDTDIPPGQTWADYIEAKLAQCSAVVVLWSETSTKSQWVREEARMGRDKSKLIPVRLDGSTPPFGFGEVQAADLSTWHGEAGHPDWKRFSQAVYAAVRGADAPLPHVQQTPPPPQHFTQQPAWQASAAQPVSDTPVALVQNALRMYVNGKGRARPKELGWFIVFYLICVFVAYFADISTSGIEALASGAANYVFLTLVYFAFICPFISLMSRRLHDTGQSGWVAALAVIPLVGAVMALVYVFIAGQPGDNQYGPDPKAGRA
ncbi:MAG: TIR domain-containing protein [Terricaulis sp.]